jgi:hypothetical protein
VAASCHVPISAPCCCCGRTPRSFLTASRKASLRSNNSGVRGFTGVASVERKFVSRTSYATATSSLAVPITSEGASISISEWLLDIARMLFALNLKICRSMIRGHSSIRSLMSSSICYEDVLIAGWDSYGISETLAHPYRSD